jgi:cell wall-associated NlpC family hydrolase
MTQNPLDIAQRLFNERIQYVWGGGHGSEPGPSFGIRDGGFADSHGDFEKIGLDASGLVRWFVYLHTGVDTANGTVEVQYRISVPVPKGEELPGDLFFPDSYMRNYVAIYLGNSMQLEIRKSGETIRVSTIDESGEFRRIVVSDEKTVEAMEIDLEVAHIGEILQRHGVAPTAELVTDLWEWAESVRGGIGAV